MCDVHLNASELNVAPMNRSATSVLIGKLTGRTGRRHIDYVLRSETRLLGAVQRRARLSLDQTRQIENRLLAEQLLCRSMDRATTAVSVGGFTRLTDYRNVDDVFLQEFLKEKL